MTKSNYKVIGVMSGTSLDGVDLIYVDFTYRKNKWYFDIFQAETIKYTNQWHDLLGKLVAFSSDELKQIDIAYTQFLSKVIKDFISKYKILHIDAICSHGHTALHQPENGMTYQIGNLNDLSKLTQSRVVCDFRKQDVEPGGQGAPLVPIGDVLLFSEYDYCLNLGGFANISTDINGKRIAYDVCPVNIVLNHYMNKIGNEYDDKGNLASTGKIKDKLFSELNALSFYNQDYPKSLGLEWVKENIFPRIDAYNLNVKDILRTFVAHIAFQISNEIRDKQDARVLITGGGTYNDFLISEIKKQTKSTLIIPEINLIEFKEALIFGLLGVLKIRNEINCLASVTGANRDHSSGKIYLP